MVLPTAAEEYFVVLLVIGEFIFMEMMEINDKAFQKLWVLFVENVPVTVSEAQIRELFEQHGDVHSVMLFTEKDAGRSSRCGWITMKRASTAVKMLNESTFAGSILQVKLMGLWLSNNASLPIEKFLKGGVVYEDRGNKREGQNARYQTRQNEKS